MTEKYDLSRRKVLGGLATIGVAGAGAGLGTSALFTDNESFTNNIVQAGTLNMAVNAEIVAANEYYTSDGSGPDIIGDSVAVDGEIKTGLVAEDVKPGDWAIICFDVCIWDNPGYVQVSTSDLETGGGENTEPERAAEGDGDNDANLQDEMIAEVYADWSSDPGGMDGLSGIDSTTPEGSTVQETYDTYSTGVTIRNSDGEPAEVGADSDSDEFDWDPDDPEAGFPPDPFCVTWYLLLYLPSEVGNEVQGDMFEFDLDFAAEQVRNNPDPFSD